MTPSIYLVAPRSDYPTYYTLEMVAAAGLEPVASIGDLTLATVAALVPDGWDVAVCLEEVSSVDYDTPASFVGITGKVNQLGRMRTVADEFRRRGKTVIMGGPHATLHPESLRASCDVLVRGELEAIAPQLFADLESGAWQGEYFGGPADLATTPVPRWDLCPNDSILIGSMQTTRGCPHDCEFCAVGSYAGRKLRHKSPAQIVAELDSLYRLGYRGAFLCDDNLTGHPRRSREILEAIRQWNDSRTDGRMTFSTQLSIDVVERDDLLSLCRSAGVAKAFIGIETPSEEALAQAKKTPNVGRPMIDVVRRFAEEGVSVTSGVIVGFDSDDRTIFERHEEFWRATAVPQLSVGALVALPGTPLRNRLAEEGRLDDRADEAIGIPWFTNIVPKGMSSSELRDGLEWLCGQLYRPDAYADRVVRHLRDLVLQPTDADRGPSPDGLAGQRLARFRGTFEQALARAADADPAVRDCIGQILRAAGNEPAKMRASVPLLLFYLQTLHTFEVAGWPLQS